MDGIRTAWHSQLGRGARIDIALNGHYYSFGRRRRKRARTLEGSEVEFEKRAQDLAGRGSEGVCDLVDLIIGEGRERAEAFQRMPLK
jgi:hypothetical protein